MRFKIISSVWNKVKTLSEMTFITSHNSENITVKTKKQDKLISVSIRKQVEDYGCRGIEFDIFLNQNGATKNGVWSWSVNHKGGYDNDAEKQLSKFLRDLTGCLKDRNSYIILHFDIKDKTLPEDIIRAFPEKFDAYLKTHIKELGEGAIFTPKEFSDNKYRWPTESKLGSKYKLILCITGQNEALSKAYTKGLFFRLCFTDIEVKWHKIVNGKVKKLQELMSPLCAARKFLDYGKLIEKQRTLIIHSPGENFDFVLELVRTTGNSTFYSLGKFQKGQGPLVQHFLQEITNISISLESNKALLVFADGQKLHYKMTNSDEMFYDEKGSVSSTAVLRNKKGEKYIVEVYQNSEKHLYYSVERIVGDIEIKWRAERAFGATAKGQVIFDNQCVQPIINKLMNSNGEEHILVTFGVENSIYAIVGTLDDVGVIWQHPRVAQLLNGSNRHFVNFKVNGEGDTRRWAEAVKELRRCRHFLTRGFEVNERGLLNTCIEARFNLIATDEMVSVSGN